LNSLMSILYHPKDGNAKERKLKNYGTLG